MKKWEKDFSLQQMCSPKQKMPMNNACYWDFVHLPLELCNDLLCHNSSTRILAFEICVFTQIEKESSFSSLILSRNLQCYVTNLQSNLVDRKSLDPSSYDASNMN